MPLHKRRALEAAILATLPGAIAEPGRVRPGRAYPPGWKRANARQVARHVMRAFARLGVRVGERTALAAYYDRTPLPYDARRVDAPASIRHAADMLNFEGPDYRRNSLIDALYEWCAQQTRAGRAYPLDAHELAGAYRAAKKRADK